MKKRANPPALITGIAAFCLWAFLLLLIRSYACQLGYTFLPKSSLEYPCAGVPPDLSPGSISTTASVPVTNTDLHVSFKHPEGWALINSGTQRVAFFDVRSATYGIKGQPSAPIFKIGYSDSGAPTAPDALDSLVDSEIDDSFRNSARGNGQHVVDELRETIDGLPAGGVRYVSVNGDKVGFRLRVSQLHQTNNFEWTSDRRYSHELEQIYYAMLPTIKIGPPPP